MSNPVTITASMENLNRIFKLAEVGARTLDAVDKADTVTLPRDLDRIDDLRHNAQEAWLAQ